MSELVSVIIPCYNAEKTIELAIQSVLAQTYRNIEIIVINDGSKDRSADIVSRMKENSRFKITLLNQANLGVSSARNKGIDNADGKYLLFLDADDIISPILVSQLVQAIKTTGSDVAYCKYSRRNIDKTHIYNYQLEDRNTLLKKQILKRKYQIGFSTYLYVRETICKHVIRFPSNIRYGEDSVFIMDYLFFCARGVYIDCALYCYTENPFSAMNHVDWTRTENLEGIRMIEKLLDGDELLPFYREYAYARAIWALVKDFAVSGQYDLFKRLDKDYCAKKYMKKLILLKQAELIVKLTSALYVINSNVFFWLFKIFNGCINFSIKKRKK